MKISHQLLLIATIMAVSTPVLAGGLGDPAPQLKIAEWIKGDPAVLAEGRGKNIYVIEFWATTCPHSRGCVPHLTEMQKKYKDQGVVFAAISVEPAETVRAFVEKMGDQMGYRVGVDETRTTTLTYLNGVFINQIPHAFVIDKSGTMVWHGHPMSGLDKTIAAVIAGTHNIDTARRRAEARSLVTLYMELVKSPSKADKAGVVGNRIITQGREDFLLMNDFAWKIATEPGLMKRDLELAMRAVQAAHDETQGKNVEILDTYARVLNERGQKQAAIEYQRKAVELATNKDTRDALQKTLTKYEKKAGKD